MLKVEENGIRWLTREEYEKIYNKAQPEIRDIMTLCISTGARINELLNCPWEKIKFDEKVIALNPKLVKGRRMEALYLNDCCIEILTRIREEHKPVKKSPCPILTIMSHGDIRKLVKRLALKALFMISADLPVHGSCRMVFRYTRCRSFSGTLRVTVTEKSYADLVKKNYSDLSDKIIEILS
ncbi:MAG: tyrosine-type recombinase/integrase [Candidatus Marinimicrobia bacterium]|nr:tyrosine-type recombinase/integrase [Candidatus Neomarinimicrobiota bacterium]